MKNKLCLLLVILLAVSIFAGCGGKNTAIDFDPQVAADSLLAGDAFSDILSPVSPEIAATLYGIDKADINSCSVYCSTGATAEEIAVFRCTDEAAAAKVEQAAHDRIQAQKDAYVSYAPQEIPKLDNAAVRKAGSYVVLVVAAKYEPVAKILDQYLK